MKRLNYRITGETPLVMHNGQLANPFNPIVREMKKITSKKRNMTDADLERLAELQFKGGLYLHEGQPCVPGEVWEATLRSAAKLERRGKQVERAVRVLSPSMLEYEGEKDPEKLWLNDAFRFGMMVRVQRQKVFRMRPIFHEWKCNLEVQFDETVFNPEDIDNIVSKAGDNGFLMEWEGRYGKYSVEKI